MITVTDAAAEKLMGALARALPKLKNPAFDSKNPHFNSKFASLSAVRAAIVPVLAEHGVAVMQVLVTDDHGVGCITRFIHESGQYMDTPAFTVPVDKGNAQAACAASTYARRYSLQAACGVVGDDDDDGNTASSAPPKPAAKAPSKAVAKQDAEDEKYTILVDKIAQATTQDELEQVRAHLKAVYPTMTKSDPLAIQWAKRQTEIALAGPITGPPAAPDPLAGKPGDAPKIQPDTLAAITEEPPLKPVVRAGTLDERLVTEISQANPRSQALCEKIVTALYYRLDDATRRRLFEAAGADATKVRYGLNLEGWRKLAAVTIDACRLGGLAV